MASSIEDLRKRGMAEEKDIVESRVLEDEVLFQRINSTLAVERTAAIHILAEKHLEETEFVNLLLDRLCIEKSLYTKIEICNCLVQGTEKTAGQMTGYLGKIGRNQHKVLPEKVSKKKSYPLPRDIIARTMGKMSPGIITVLLEVLKSGTEEEISEVLDAIGFLTFYHRELATQKNVISIIDVMKQYHQNKIIVWKSVLCLSAFPLEVSIDILEEIRKQHEKSVIGKEAERSLKLLQMKNRKAL